MYLLYCDETNLEEKPGIFFVYGGISINSNIIRDLSKEIDALRLKYKIPCAFSVKFNPGPNHLEHPQFIEFKQSIIEIVIKYNCKLFTSFILHDIAKTPEEARRNEINRICYHFNCFLNRKSEHGLVLIDKFSDKQIDHHLRRKFSIGVEGLPYSENIRLENIVGFHYAAIGQSHLCSVIDIILGSLRFAVNAAITDTTEYIPTSKKLLSLLSPLFYRESDKDTISELGIFFSPKIIRSDRYFDIYNKLRNFLIESSIVPDQKISHERNY